MRMELDPENNNWSFAGKFIFRFFFIYILYQLLPWFIASIPWIEFITKYFFQFTDWIVTWANTHIFHVKEVLVPKAGSGDTSFGWAEQWTVLLLATVGAVIWTIIDRKRKSYRRLNYWLCLVTRYAIALIAFLYGISKVLLMQMPYPSLSQMATPLGDFLPMRFSWMFMGYSAPYQIFAGLLECLACFLLLYRRTATLGAVVATGVFLNVMMLNLSYDIPVKIFSMNMVLFCLFLLANESKRMIGFFFLNKPVEQSRLYHFSYSSKWIRITRVILKIVFVLMVIKETYNTYQFVKEYDDKKSDSPISSGVYDVKLFVVNGDTLPLLFTDTLIWQDFIIDRGGLKGSGSIKTNDTLFKKRYNRRYFTYTADSLKKTFNLEYNKDGNANYLAFHYNMPDNNTLQLTGSKLGDSLFVELKRSSRTFQLGEKQFHWLTESNR